MRRLVVFDVDGTLVDSQGHILAAMEAAFAGCGRPMPPREAALSVVGLSLPVALARLFPDAGEAELGAMAEGYRSAFQRIRLSGAGASPLYPGTREMLAGLSRAPGTLLGLATGKSRRGLDHLLDLHGLAPFFATRQVADDHPSKPHPAMLEAALAETGAERGASVMVGDTAFDLEMGRAAGLRTVAVTWGYHRREMLAGADALIGSWAELPSVLADFAEAA
ncbi:MAG: HAD-IA family hydrolase [Rhodobacteraceae bacterium]|nr:HAD-IA family hydrolase [Paracoccaceae bacterium]